MKHTAKQEAFIRWYCSAEVNANGTEAARRAGYSGNASTLASMAKENLRKPHIRDEIDKRVNAALSRTNITVEKVLGDLEATYLRATEVGNFGAAVRCLEIQGKYLKMFTNKIEHAPTIEEASTEELIELLREVMQSGHLDINQLLSESEMDHSGDDQCARLVATA